MVLLWTSRQLLKDEKRPSTSGEGKRSKVGNSEAGGGGGG